MNLKNLLSVLLSIISIFILVFLFILDENTELYKLLNYYDLVLCVFFFYDFLISLKNSKNKWKYFYKFGFIDLLSSIPSVGWLRFGRVVKIFRVLRIIKSFNTIKKFIKEKNNKYSIFGLIYILVFIISPILILIIEQDAVGSNIKTAEDSIWWTYISITTVGYGDHFPVTNLGRIVASVLILFGVCLFGLVTSYFTFKFNKISEKL